MPERAFSAAFGERHRIAATPIKMHPPGFRQGADYDRRKEMTDLRGEFKSTLDAKGRMNFPVKLRDELGAVFMISKTIGAPCIKVYKKDDWEALVGRIREMPQTKTADLQRFLFGSAFDIEPDKQGRALIPAPLREYAGLDTDVVIVGLEGRAEIWDKAKWDEVNRGTDTKSLVDVAVELGL
jgi:MraZ protein